MPDPILSDLSTNVMIYVAACAFLSATFHSVSGYAGGLILAICLAPVIGVKAVVPVLAMSLLISHSSRVWAFRTSIQWPIYRDVMITALPGIIFGASIYSLLPIGGIAIVLGVFLLASAPLRRVMQRMKVEVGRKALMGAGVPFGVLSGAAIGAGLIL
ncbi:MAG: sulfite exporter TauE/SafE family protein, partial [Alphaproteobacteria bacterium]